jgi:hypothetical protein
MAVDNKERKGSLLSFLQAVVAKLGRKSEREGISIIILLCAPSPGVTWAHVIELVGRAGAVILGIDCALASALDLAGLGTLPWLFLAYRASIFLVLYTQSL